MRASEELKEGADSGRSSESGPRYGVHVAVLLRENGKDEVDEGIPLHLGLACLLSGMGFR